MPGQATSVADAAAPPNVLSVVFRIMPEGVEHAEQVPSAATVADAARALDDRFGLPASSFTFSIGGAVLDQSQTFAALGPSPVVDVTPQLPADEGVAQDYHMPDVLTVQVRFGADQPPRVVHVQIARELPADGKPFLGGYRHKHTGVEYHHSSTQSVPEPRPEGAPAPELPPPKFERDTQTSVVVTRSTQPRREFGTQVDRPGVWLSEADDRHIAPLPYFSADEYEALRLEAALQVQRFTRGYFARRRAAALVAEAQAAAKAAAELSAQRRAEAEARHKHEVQRRMHPRTEADFETLFKDRP